MLRPPYGISPLAESIAAARSHHAGEDFALLRQPPVSDEDPEVRGEAREAVLLHSVALGLGEIARHVLVGIRAHRGRHDVEVFALRDTFRLRGGGLRAQREGGKKRGSRYPGGRREQIYHFISPF